MSEDHVYLNGEILPLERARISPEDRGFLFGDGVYESIRYYPRAGAEFGELFEFERHVERLRASLAALRFDDVALAPLLDAIGELVRVNGLATEHASVYVQLTRGVAPRMHAFPGAETPPTIYARARRFEPPTSAWRDGVDAVTVEDLRWGRCDVKSIALLANVLANEDARARGAFEALFVRNGWVTEGSHTAAAFVVDGVMRLHPSGPLILPSVTREAVLELARRAAIAVEERAVAFDELASIDEAFVMGTTTEVMPVVRIDDRPVGDGRVGPITRALQRDYFALHP